MKVSVITATYNSEGTIRDTLASVRAQSYESIEYIVIDGGSNDATLSILHENKDIITKLVSEKDSGIYDALNKGIVNSSGDIVGFLHSDDVFEDESTISEIVSAFLKKDVDAVYGDLLYVRDHQTKSIFRYWRGTLFSRWRLYYGWMPAHPTFYVKRSIYREKGLYDQSFRIGADYELTTRLFIQKDFKTHYIPKVLVNMKVGGASNKSLTNFILKMKEEYQVIRKYQIGGVITLLLKSTSKIPQLLRKI